MEIEVISHRDLNAGAFERSPAWSEFYDQEEIAEVASWDIDREWFLAQLNSKADGNEHPCYSIPLQRLPLERMRIFLKAGFQTPTGALLKGYIVNHGYAISIFDGEEQFVFSTHPMLANLNKDHAARLALCLRIPASRIFPVKILLPIELAALPHSKSFSPAID